MLDLYLKRFYGSPIMRVQDLIELLSDLPLDAEINTKKITVYWDGEIFGFIDCHSGEFINDD